MGKRLEKEDVFGSLQSLMDDIENDEISNVHADQKDALKQVIEQYETGKRPIATLIALEDWLYKQKEKPLELKSAILWGGLFVLREMDCIDWDTMRKMYGEFMSKQMNLR